MHNSGPLRLLRSVARAQGITQQPLYLQRSSWSVVPLLLRRSRFQNPRRELSVCQRRLHSIDDGPAQRPLTDRDDASEELGQQDADTIAARKALSPAYQLWVTCKKCLERSSHTISKQAYHFGSCVIQCPKCKAKHLISDNLKIFSDTNVTMEDIARQHGEKLKKGRLGIDGDIEFYDDKATQKVLRAQHNPAQEILAKHKNATAQADSAAQETNRTDGT